MQEINIYNVEQSLYNTLLEIQEAEGELTPELEQSLDINRENLVNKIADINKMRKTSEFKMREINEEINRLGFLYKKIENFTNNIDKVISKTVATFGEEVSTSKAKNKPLKIEYPLGEVVLSFTESVQVPDTLDYELDHYANFDVTVKGLSSFELSLFKEKYPNAKEKLSYDKKSIKEAIIAGSEFENASIQINQNLKWI